MRKRKVSKEKIVEYAKELYLTPDEAGMHKYSSRAIAKKVKQKFSKSLASVTVLNWAHKYGWDKLWEQAVKEGVTKNFKSDEEKSKEEQFKELIAERKQKDFEIASDLKKWAHDYIREHGFSNANEALKAIDLGMKYTQDLQELVASSKTSLKDFLMRLLTNGDSNSD